jgi:hypothetical protein
MKSFIYGLYTGALNGVVFAFVSGLRWIDVYAAMAVLALILICLFGLAGCFVTNHPGVARTR